jgi:hypothetical protein
MAVMSPCRLSDAVANGHAGLRSALMEGQMVSGPGSVPRYAMTGDIWSGVGMVGGQIEKTKDRFSGQHEETK